MHPLPRFVKLLCCRGCTLLDESLPEKGNGVCPQSMVSHIAYALQAQIWKGAQEEQEAQQEKGEEDAPALAHASALRPCSAKHPCRPGGVMPNCSRNSSKPR